MMKIRILIPFYKKHTFRDGTTSWFAGYVFSDNPNIVWPMCPAPNIFRAIWVLIKYHPLLFYRQLFYRRFYRKLKQYMHK